MKRNNERMIKKTIERMKGERKLMEREKGQGWQKGRKESMEGRKEK